jgi:hypothetical protein
LLGDAWGKILWCILSWWVFLLICVLLFFPSLEQISMWNPSWLLFALLKLHLWDESWSA